MNWHHIVLLESLGDYCCEFYHWILPTDSAKSFYKQILLLDSFAGIIYWNHLLELIAGIQIQTSLSALRCAKKKKDIAKTR